VSFKKDSPFSAIKCVLFFLATERESFELSDNDLLYPSSLLFWSTDRYLFIFLFVFLRIPMYVYTASIRAWFIVTIFGWRKNYFFIFLFALDHPDKKCLDTVDGKPFGNHLLYYYTTPQSSPETNIAWLRPVRCIYETRNK